MTVNLELNIANEPHTGIFCYADEIIRRSVKLRPDWTFEGGVCFNSRISSETQYPFSIHTLPMPYGTTFHRNKMIPLSYNCLARSRADVFVFWGNCVPRFPIKGKVVSFIHDITPYHVMEDSGKVSINYKKQIQRVIQFSNCIVTTSEYTKNDLCTYFSMNQQKVEVIPAAVDINKYAAFISPEKQQEVRNRYGLPKRYYLYVGSTYQYKNLLNVLSAIRFLPEEIRENYKFVIANSADYLKEYARTAGIENSVVFLNGIDEADKVSLYKMAVLTVFVSKYEGFGMPVIEAMAAGTPVITSNRSSMPEIAGDAAILVNPDSEREIADAIRNVISDEELKNTLIQKGKKNIERFSWDKSAEYFCDLLEEI